MEKDHVVISLEKYESLKSAVVEAEVLVENEKKQTLNLTELIINLIRTGSTINFSSLHPGENNMHILFSEAGYTVNCELPNGQTASVGRGGKVLKLTSK